MLNERGWEMVSPVDKNGGEIQRPGEVFGGGVFQAAAAGGAAGYSSLFSFGDAQGAQGASQYISRRHVDGWATENVTTPSAAGVFGTDPDGVPYQLFSTDLGRGIVLEPQRCEVGSCPRRYRLRQSSDGALSATLAERDLIFAGASADLAHTVLSTCAALTADATEVAGVGGCDPAKANLYDWSGGGLALINHLPGHSQGTPGARLAAQGAGSVSENGRRIYFSFAGGLYLRDGSETMQVDEALGGGGSFQAASSDGAITFFTKAEHLYRYSVATGAAADLTPAGGVVGVLGASADGAYLYYLSGGGLFLEHDGVTSKAAAAADASNYPPSTATARIAADGDLAFLSSAGLGGANTGGYSQVYLYSPAIASLRCISCRPSGTAPLGVASIPGAVANGKLAGATRIYKPRALVGNGSRVFFDSVDALVLTDTNKDRDVYEWEEQGVGNCNKVGGCIGLVSSGRAEGGATFLDASADGADVFFVTDGSLVTTDPGASDVYDARIGGGFAVVPPPIACVADACQLLPGEAEDPAVGTGFYLAETNPPVRFSKPQGRKKKHHRKHKKTQQHRSGRAGHS